MFVPWNHSIPFMFVPWKQKKQNHSIPFMFVPWKQKKQKSFLFVLWKQKKNKTFLFGPLKAEEKIIQFSFFALHRKNAFGSEATHLPHQQADAVLSPIDTYSSEVTCNLKLLHLWTFIIVTTMFTPPPPW